MSKCNPLAHPRLFEGKCVCAFPYTGRDCTDCEDGFRAERPRGNVPAIHVRCIPEGATTKNLCNGHGKPKMGRAFFGKDVECDCDSGFGGKFCDYCTDSTLAYPDCEKGGLKSDMYNSEAAHAFLTRRKYETHGYSTAANKYFKAGELEPTIFNEECGWVDFPDDLDRTEYSREFKEGEFHIADLYVVNHRQDNIIKYIPRSAGVLKVLL